MLKKGYISLVSCIFFVCSILCAQEKNNPSQDSITVTRKLFNKVVQSISVNNPIPVQGTPMQEATKNALDFEPYEGKFIRYVYVNKLGFNKLLLGRLLN